MARSKPKNVYGMRVAVTVGDTPKADTDEDAIVGADINVHVSPDQLQEGGSVTGLGVSVSVGDDPDDLLRQIIAVLQSTDDPRRAQVIDLACTAIAEDNKTTKWQTIRQIITIGADIAQIASLALTLAQMAP